MHFTQVTCLTEFLLGVFFRWVRLIEFSLVRLMNGNLLSCERGGESEVAPRYRIVYVFGGSIEKN